MNLLTLSDILPVARRFVDSGAVCDPNALIDAIHEANQRLLLKADWPHTTMLVRAKVDKDTFPLPREAASIRAVNFDNMPSTVESPYFQFMSAGPGEAQSWTDGLNPNLEEVGRFPTMYDLPDTETWVGPLVSDITQNSLGLRIMAFSTSPADATKTIQIRGRSHTNTPHSSSSVEFNPDETVKIVPWNGAEGSLQGSLAQKPMSANVYRSITSWTKPVTAGHISLYGVNPTTSEMYFLAKAHPNDLAPTWRRFRIRNKLECGENILMLCKIAAERPSLPTDIMPIQNLAAMKSMLQAISNENAGNLNAAVNFEANAVRLLTEQKADSDNQGPTVQVIDHDCTLFGSSFSRYVSR